MTQDYAISPSNLITNDDRQWKMDHLKRALKYTTQTSLLAGGLTGAAYYVAKNAKYAGKAANIFDKGVNFVGKIASKIAKPKSGVISKVVSKLKNLPTKYKIFGMAAATGLVFLDGILKQNAYDAGKIDQKYSDMKEQKHCTAEDVKEFYANGGKGVRFA